MTTKLKIFIAWLMRYDWQWIDEKSADMCIKVLHSNATQYQKETALDFLMLFENFNPGRLKKMFASYKKLNAYNQEYLVDIQMGLCQEDLSPQSAKQTLKNLWMLLSNSKYPGVCEWAADEMCDYVHPFSLNKAIKKAVKPHTQYQHYFSKEFFWSHDLEYKTTKNWGRKKKAAWVEENAGYLPSPAWCLGDRPIYVYIFTVANYPDKWGDISLPGCAKDNHTFQKLFRPIATGGMEFFDDDIATNKNYFDCIKSMAKKENDAIHIFCNSHHGSWDAAGNHCQLLYDFDYNQQKQSFENTPTAKQIHNAVNIAAQKSPNILPIFIGDYCGSGGVAIEKRLSNKIENAGLKVKSFHPEGWNPPTIPSTHFEGIRRNSREIWLSGCRPEYYTYDTPEGGAFTNAFADSFSINKNFSKIMKQTGRKLIKNNIPSVPWLVCSAGRQRFKLKPKK